MKTPISPQNYVRSILGKNYPTQAKAAEDIGIEHNTVRRWFNGLRKPDRAAVRAIQLLDYIKSLGLEAPPPIDFGN